MASNDPCEDTTRRLAEFSGWQGRPQAGVSPHDPTGRLGPRTYAGSNSQWRGYGAFGPLGAMPPVPTPLGATPSVTPDAVRPTHYSRFLIEPITFIMANELPYWAGNVVKYVCRAPHKHVSEEEDIRKAIRYCEMRLEELKRAREGTRGDALGRPL